MVRVFSSLPLAHLQGPRRDDPSSPAATTYEASPRESEASMSHPSLAECLLYGMRFLEYARSPLSFRPIPRGPRLTGEPYAGEPHVRFGGRGVRVSGRPYPYYAVAAIAATPSPGCHWLLVSQCEELASKPTPKSWLRQCASSPYGSHSTRGPRQPPPADFHHPFNTVCSRRQRNHRPTNEVCRKSEIVTV